MVASGEGAGDDLAAGGVHDYEDFRVACADEEKIVAAAVHGHGDGLSGG